MSDRLRIVSLSAGGRPVAVRDLENGSTFMKLRDSFKIAGPAKKPILSQRQRRWGGARTVGETHDNGSVSWTAMVQGASADIALQNIAALLVALDYDHPDHLLEWRPDGATYSTFFEIRGGATWDPQYKWITYSQGQYMLIGVTIPVSPVTVGLPMDIGDDFTVDTVTAAAVDGADYTFDAGAQADMTVGVGGMLATANLAVEKRLIHTARGYTYGDHQVTVVATPVTTITGFKAGCVIKRIDANSYLEAYVDDNGTNSRIRIDKIVAGVRTNLATANLAARVLTGAYFAVRGRIAGNALTAEYFIGARNVGTPATALAAATLSVSYTLAIGAEQNTFGAAAAGRAGMSFIPQNVGAAVGGLSVRPFTYSAVTTPAYLTLNGAIPGDVPAATDVTITTSLNSEAQVVWAMLGMSRHFNGAGGVLQLVEAEALTLSGLTSTADASARGGNVAQVTAAGAQSGSAAVVVTPSNGDPDAFADKELTVEVWARVKMLSTVVSPVVTLSLEGALPVAIQYSAEYGATGKALTAPSAGTVYRFMRIGSLRVRCDAGRLPASYVVRVTLAQAAGSAANAFALDYLVALPAGNRSSLPTNKAQDATFPAFTPNQATNGYSKTITSELRGLIDGYGADGSDGGGWQQAVYTHSGLGGSLIELPVGSVDAIVKLSDTVPDRTDGSTTYTERLNHSATVHFAVTPRYELARGS